MTITTSDRISGVIIDGIMLSNLNNNNNSNSKMDRMQGSINHRRKHDELTTEPETGGGSVCSSCLQSVQKSRVINFMYDRLTIIGWLSAYNADALMRDVIAGLTVGLTAIPQGIAYAVVAGLAPQYGLYTSIMSSLVYVIFGTCKQIVIGPTAIMSLMTQPLVSSYGYKYSILLAFLSGCIAFVLGLFHSGFLVEFISMPVTVGFTSAAAVTIASSQVKSFFGLPGKSSDFVGSIESIIENVNQIRWTDTLLGVITIFILIIGRYGKTKAVTWSTDSAFKRVIAKTVWILGLSSNAIVVIFGTLLAYSFAIYDKQPFLLTGNVTGGLPEFALPPFSVTDGNKTTTFVEMVSNMGSAVITVPLISIMELIAIVKAFEKGKVIDASREIMTLGMCNVAGSFIGAMPVSGSFTRTAINHASGVVTPFSGIFTVMSILLALQYLTSLFYYIPKATLAALIITAMFFMIEFHAVIKIWRTKKPDLIPLFMSFFACLFFGIEFGMIAGICTNLMFLLYKSARPSVKLQCCNINNEEFLIVTPTQNLSFPASEYIRDLIINTCVRKNITNPVIILGTHIYNIDSSVAKGITLLAEDLKARSQRLYLWKWRDSAIKTCVGYDSTLHKYFYFDNTLLTLLKGTGEVDGENIISDVISIAPEYRE